MLQEKPIKNTAKRYQRIKLGLSLTETIISFILICLFVFAGYSAELRNYVNGLFGNPYLRLLIFVLFIGIGFSVFSFPLNFIRSYWIEHHFNLSNQTLLGWLWEQTKALLVAVVLLVPILLIFYYFLNTFPTNWWFWTSTILFVFSILIGKVAPQIIFPLFYKFEPLAGNELLNRMQGLAKKGKFSLQGVYRFNMSKTTKKANAAFTGFGKTRRIILGDTLLDGFSVDEIETVFAHEVGHYVHKHLLKGIVQGTLTNYLSLFIAALLYDMLINYLGFRGVADLAALPLLSLIISLFALITGPLSNIISRKYESQADTYALEHSTKPAAFITSMKKLSDMNLSDQEPHPLIEFLFHSHPSIKSRVEQAERFITEKSITGNPFGSKKLQPFWSPQT